MACSTQVQIRRGNTADNAAFIGVQGEITYDTQSHRLITHDGAAVGGFKIALLSEVPQTTTALPEGANLYYTDARARAALSVSGPLGYNPGTGVFSITLADSTHDGYISQGDWNAFNAKQAALGFTPENVANKSNDTTLAADSATLYPTQHAVKTYADTGLALKQNSLGFTPENVANKDTDGTLAANSDTKYASQKATKTYADTKQAALGFTPENVANKDTDGTLAANSDTKYASQKATKTYADTKQSALGFTPENVANKSNDTTLAADSATLYPTQHAVKSYVASAGGAFVPIAGGTMTGLLNFSGTTNPGIQLNSLTSVQRTALANVAGYLVWNTTLSRVERNNGAGWLVMPENTGDLAEGSNLYYTDARARAAVSITAPLTYNAGTGVFGIVLADTTHDGYLSSANWNTFNGKQAALGFTPENVANKSTDGTFAANSDTLYPSQKAAKTYADTGLALKLNLSGGTMSGAIAMGTSKITGLGNPTLAQDAATKAYVDGFLPLAGGTMTGAILFSPDNTLDFGAAGATRVRTGYFGTSVFAAASMGVNTISPVTKFTVVDTLTSSPRGISSVQYNTGTNGAHINTRKARGTEGTPTTVVTGDTLGLWASAGYDGTNFLEMGLVMCACEGTVAATRVPTRLVFSTATDATPSVLTERLRIDSAGLSTFAGAISMGSNKITNLGTPTAAADATTKAYVDAAASPSNKVFSYLTFS